MRLKYKVGVLICLLALLYGCNGDDSTSNNTSPFAGIWNVAFDGAWTGDGQIAVGPDGNFTANLVLLDTTGSDIEDEFTADGKISDSGTLPDGRINNGNAQVGTLTGNFTANTASGTYQRTVGGSGTWSASK